MSKVFYQDFIKNSTWSDHKIHSLLSGILLLS